MPYKVMRRLDVSILFKIYCWLKKGTELDEAECLFSDFYYSGWNKTEDLPVIKEAFKRLQTAGDFGVRFEIRKERVRFALCHISELKRFFKEYIARMQRNENLLPADGENTNECIRLLKFSRQQNLILRYIFKQYEDTGERIVIIRTNFDEEIGRFYQLFCFEELLIDLELKGFIEIIHLDSKTPDGMPGVLSPIVSAIFHPIKEIGAFGYNVISNSVEFNQGEMSWSLQSKTGQEVAQAIFIKCLIEAGGEFVKTRELERSIGEKVQGYDGNGSLLYYRLPEPVKEKIAADGEQQGPRSRGYRIVLPSPVVEEAA